MGNWNYNPMDNDEAWDYLIDVGKEITAYRDTKLWGRIGVVEMLLKQGYPVKANIIKKCIEYLKELSKNEDYLNSWKDVEKIKTSINNFQCEFEKLTAKGYEEIYVGRGWQMRDFELECGTSRTGLAEKIGV